MTLTLHQAIRIASRIAPKRSPMPAIETLLLEPTEGGLRIRATNIEFWADFDVAVEHGVERAMSLPASVLRAVVGGMEAVSLRSAGDKLIVESDGTSIELGSWKADLFPPLPDLPSDHETYPFDPETFAWASADVATDDSRPVLSGVAFFPESRAFAATDGFRLRAAGTIPPPSEHAVIIPARAATVMPPGVESIEVWPHWLAFKGSFTLYVRRIVGTYPNFSTLIPAKGEGVSFEIGSELLRKALKPLARFDQAARSSGICRIEGDPTGITFTIRAEEIGMAATRLAVAASDAFKVALQMKFLENAARSAGETVRFQTTGMSSQVLFEYGDRREVVMPMFVQWS